MKFFYKVGFYEKKKVVGKNRAKILKIFESNRVGRERVSEKTSTYKGKIYIFKKYF